MVRFMPPQTFIRQRSSTNPPRSVRFPLSAKIAVSVRVRLSGRLCVIENRTRIGNNCRIDSGAVIRRECEIGNRVIIQSNAVIGSEGFGNAKEGDRWVRIPSFGSVVIGDDAEIGANTTIDRGALGPTVIGSGVKIDNLVQVAHNVSLGDNTAVAAQAGIAGSMKIGKRVMIGGQAGFAGQFEVEDDAFIGAQAGVSKTVKKGKRVTGYPARDLMTMRRIEAAQQYLPEFLKEVKRLRKEIEELKNREIGGDRPPKGRIKGILTNGITAHYRKKCYVFGDGVHTGETASVLLKPASENSGIRFVRVDLDQPVEIAADIDNVVDITRGTAIGKNGAKVYSVEHLMSAFAGLEIDNCCVEVNAQEIPLMDGSAMPWIELVQKAGIVEQAAQREFLNIDDPMVIYMKDDMTFAILPAPQFRVTIMVDYNHPALGAQHSTLISLKDYVKDFAPARTFCFLSEIEKLRRIRAH